MFGNKSRFIMKNTFLVMFYYLIKQKLLSLFRLKEQKFSWFYDLSNLILLKIVRNKLSKNTEDKFQNLVLSGPFKKLIIDKKTFVPSQILGMFENELHSLLINKLLKKKYQSLINLGTANGYYLLGLLKFGIFLKAYAIDIDTKHFEKIKNLIKINSIQCEVKFLSNFDKFIPLTKNINNSLIVCDIEGAEKKIIDIIENPWLVNNDILVEVHNTDTVIKINNHFSATHTIKIINNAATFNYKLPEEIKNHKNFNHIDKLYLSGSLRIMETPWMYLENKLGQKL